MPFEKSYDPPQASGPVCQHLRTKAMYVTGTREPSAAHLGSGHCWCNLTQNVRGPDSQLVERRACDSGRSCYEASL